MAADPSATAVASPVLELFLELCALPSPPGDERAVADVVLRYLRDIGLTADEDGAAASIGSNAGNIYARLEPTAEGTPLFLCAHLDTVPLTGELRPVVDEGVVRNAGGTILGADNKSALAAMLDAVRRVLVENRPHAGVELVLTPMEEVGLVGAGAFDASRLRARHGFVYDHAAPIGYVVIGAPHQRTVEATFVGRAAHAGMYPEDGRSAIVAASRAVAEMRLGRIDDETTANVGLITGGSAKNVVPARCWISLDLRSHDERKLGEVVQEVLDAIAFGAASAECAVDTEVRESFRGYGFKRDDDVVQLALGALTRCGYDPQLGLSGGGADANVFNERGFQCLNLANGMAEIHSPDEHIAVADLDAMVDVTLSLLDAALA
jgi:tripeptide aminopeptidase